MNLLDPIARGLLLLILLRGALCDECGPCACSENVGGHVVSVNCAARGLTSVPEVFPSKTLSLDFSGNRMAPGNLNSLCAYDLVNVNLTGNHLTSLSSHQFVRCYITGQIDFDENIFENITESSFAGLRDVKVVLNLESQYFHPLSLSTLTDLRELSIVLHQNALSNDLFKKSRLVHTLTIEIPNAFDIPEDLFRPMSETLKTLTLIANSLSFIGEDILKGCTKLETFELRARNLHSIPSVLFNSAPSLSRIRMRGVVSLPRHVFENIDQLEVLEIHGVEDMPSDEFAGLSVLKVLDLSDGFVSKIKFEWFKDLRSLERLVLANVGLKTLTSDDFIGLSSLKNLDLSRNQLRKIERFTFKHVSDTIKYIGLGKNSLKTVSDDTFVGLAQLETLDLSSNEIHSVTKDALASLEELKELLLHDNKIYLLPKGIFDRNSKLEALDISSNVINELLPSVFESLTSLRILNISDNLLVSVTSLEMYDYPYIKKIDLSFNRFKCRCVNLDFTNILDDLYILGTCWYNITIDKVDFKTYMGSSECRPKPSTSPQTSVFVTNLAPGTDRPTPQVGQYTDRWTPTKHSIDRTRVSSVSSPQRENTVNGTSSCPACTTTNTDTETRTNTTEGQKRMPIVTLQTDISIGSNTTTTEINPLPLGGRPSTLQSFTNIQTTTVNSTTTFAESGNGRVSKVGNTVAALTQNASSTNTKTTALSTSKGSSYPPQTRITGRLLNTLSIFTGSLATSTSDTLTTRPTKGSFTTTVTSLSTLLTHSVFNNKSTSDITTKSNSAVGNKLTTSLVSTSSMTSTSVTPPYNGTSSITPASDMLPPTSNTTTATKSVTPNKVLSVIYATFTSTTANNMHSSTNLVTQEATKISSTRTTPESLISTSTSSTPTDVTFIYSTSLSKRTSNIIQSVSPSTLETIIPSIKPTKVADTTFGESSFAVPDSPSISSISLSIDKTSTSLGLRSSLATTVPLTIDTNQAGIKKSQFYSLPIKPDAESRPTTHFLIGPSTTSTTDTNSGIDASLSATGMLVTGTRPSTDIEQPNGLTSTTMGPGIKSISSTNVVPQLIGAPRTLGTPKATTISQTVTNALSTGPSLDSSQNIVPQSASIPQFPGIQQYTGIPQTSGKQGTTGTTSLPGIDIALSRTYSSTDEPSVFKSTGHNKANTVNSFRKADENGQNGTKALNHVPPCFKSSTTASTQNSTDRIGNKTDVNIIDSRELPETVLNLEEGSASKYVIFIAIACISAALLACMLVVVYLLIRKSRRRRAYEVSNIEAQRLKKKRLNVPHGKKLTERKNGSLQKLPPVPMDTVDSEKGEHLVVNSVAEATV